MSYHQGQGHTYKQKIVLSLHLFLGFLDLIDTGIYPVRTALVVFWAEVFADVSRVSDIGPLGPLIFILVYLWPSRYCLMEAENDYWRSI